MKSVEGTPPRNRHLSSCSGGVDRSGSDLEDGIDMDDEVDGPEGNESVADKLGRATGALVIAGLGVVVTSGCGVLCYLMWKWAINR